MDTRTYPGATGGVRERTYSDPSRGIAAFQVTFGLRHDSRFRVTVAQVNAGFTLLPAIPGVKWRLFDIILIAIGGNASGSTDVRILGTQATASAALGIAAVAGLTRSTVLRAGSPFATAGVASIVVLADGASFTACDGNTAITCGKTGGTLATSTFIDVLLGYTADPQ